ncbi:MAG: diphosphomevalonate decarboxylase [Flavobacteriaceae bacterium]|nr:MAG: diphosphomevalonate decarboxylase [Flavobacteriaceae bacterium]
MPDLAEYTLIQSAKVSQEAPSNIALVKYWGKKEIQIPTNSSLSFTLTKAKTKTEVGIEKKSGEGFEVVVYFEGNQNEKFKEKILKFFERIHPFVPFLQSYRFEIHTENTFPHSSGIASSASGFAALALCLVEIEILLGADFSPQKKQLKSSFLARLGSGSACRSVYKGLVYWGENPNIKGSNKRFAIEAPFEVAPVFKTFRDTILLIEEGQKKVSSTAGHALMENHPYRDRRFELAEENILKFQEIFKNGDLKAFVALVEQEALGLHSLMMTSSPPYLLMSTNTLVAINLIWEYRRQTDLPLCFTLDAGANLHLLYPESCQEEVGEFVKEMLAPLCSDKKYIEDTICW